MYRFVQRHLRVVVRVDVAAVLSVQDVLGDSLTRIDATLGRRVEHPMDHVLDAVDADGQRGLVGFDAHVAQFHRLLERVRFTIQFLVVEQTLLGVDEAALVRVLQRQTITCCRIHHPDHAIGLPFDH